MELAGSAHAVQIAADSAAGCRILSQIIKPVRKFAAIGPLRLVRYIAALPVN
jgi:hypothetical protein